MENSKIMIEVINLSKQYNEVTAVDQLSFKVDKGQTLALIGTSGSGKTTTLKMINRLIEPTDGKILVDSDLVNDLPVEQMRRRMGYVIQEGGLFPHYTVAENISIVPKLLKWDKERIKERINQLLHNLGLPSSQFAEKFPAQLSGGQRQRVGIARALAADPPIVLMDEPFGALDPITRQKVRREFMELDELASKTTIFVTHDVEEAFEMADLVCLLHDGQMQQLDSPAQLLFHPSNDFVAQFLAGQQLQLEFGAIRLKQLAPYLPKSNKTIQGKAIFLSHEESLRSALSRLSAGNGLGQISEDMPLQFFNSAQLVEAFYKFKNDN